MKTLNPDDLINAAANSVIADRCRAAYLHDIRGTLQALHGAVELLGRAVQSAEATNAMRDRAALIARRALAAHDSGMVEMLNQITARDDPAGPLDLGELVPQILRFLGNDAASKNVSFELSTTAAVPVIADRIRLRFLLQGLIANTLDTLPRGGVLRVLLRRDGNSAQLELQSAGHPAAAEVTPARKASGGTEQETEVSALELAVTAARRWIAAQGGRLEAISVAAGPPQLRIYYPLAAA
jgi:two-component system sensor histidine kinase QseC